jgi:uncharacterized membrane protein YhaH (DUF805 family)
MDEKQDGSSFSGLMPLLFSFKGRINRAKFWAVTIAINIISYPIHEISVDKMGGDTAIFIALGVLLLIAFLSYSRLSGYMIATKAVGGC